MEDEQIEPYEYEEEPESLAEVLQPLIPLGEELLRNANENMKAQLEVQKMVSQQDFSLKSKQMDVEKFKFARLYWMVLALMIGLMGIAAGIIFALRDVEKGILLISHLIALAVGALGGFGFKKIAEKKD